MQNHNSDKKIEMNIWHIKKIQYAKIIIQTK